MFATVTSRLQNDPLSFNLAVSRVISATAIRDCEDVEPEVETGDSHLDSLQEAIVEAQAALTTSLQDHENAKAKVDAWERQLQTALKIECETQICQALCNKNACIDRARHLQGLVEQYSVQVSTLKTQLAFWDQVAI